MFADDLLSSEMGTLTLVEKEKLSKTLVVEMQLIFIHTRSNIHISINWKCPQRPYHIAPWVNALK